MLGSLFKPAWQSKSSDKRKQFINELTQVDESVLNVLKQLILKDEDSEVRKLALHKIEQPDLVFELIKSGTPGNTRDEAVQLFTKLTGAKSKLTEEEFRQLIKTHPETTLSITKTCPHSNLRLELLESISLEEQIDLIADIEYSDTRSYIAEKISTIELLEKARTILKGKDKNAEKIIKSKLHDIHAKQKKDEENLEKSETLCDAMEYLASRDNWRNEFNDRYTQCIREWQALDFTPEKYLSERYTIAQQKVKLRVEKQEIIDKAQHTQNTVTQDLISECKNIAVLSIDELLAQQASLDKSFNEKKETWVKSLETIKPENSLWKNFEAASKSINSALNFAKLRLPLDAELSKVSDDSNTQTLNTLSKQYRNILANLDWSKDFPKLQIKDAALEEIHKLTIILAKQNKKASDKLDKLHQRINRLQGSTKRGNLAQARRELTAVIKLSESYTGKDKVSLEERLEKATIAVDKMADWKDYATAPKFIELCEAMEALSPEALNKANKSTMHADKLAVKITELQKKWKALGHSDSADEHWERFKKAADIAYAPCDTFFKQRDEIRKNNLAKREPLVKEMQSLVTQTNWQNNNECKKALSSIRKIDDTWKTIKDVEPGPGTKQWKRLRKAKNSVYEKLDEVYSANLTLKKALITNSKELLEEDIKEDTLKKLQTIQSQWKDIGITKRKDDQKAWEAFKQATDAVFEKIQGQRKAKRAKEDEQLKPYRDVVKAIQQLSRTAKSLADADSNFSKLQSDHDALPPMPHGLPEKVIEGIKKDYQRACSDFNKTRERIVQKKKHQALDNLATKAALCNTYESLALSASQVELDDLKAQMDALEISDNELRKRFDKRLAVAKDTDRTGYTEVRKLMCIDLEILLGKDSPEEDKSQRMQIQLERMQKGGFGQDRVEKSAVLKQMKLDWYCLPGAEPDMQAKLDERFQKLIK